MTASRTGRLGDGTGHEVHGAELAQLFGGAGAVLAVGLNAPQVWRSCARRQVAGLSPASRWLGLVHSCSWIVYGVVTDTPLQTLTNVVCGSMHAAVLCALLLLHGPARSPQVLVPQALLGTAALGGMVACAVTGALPVGLLAAALGSLAVVPQLWLLSRGGDASGVSPMTVHLSLLCALAWSAHGLLLGAAEIWVPSLLSTVAAAWTLRLLGRPGGGVPRPAALRGRRPVTA